MQEDDFFEILELLPAGVILADENGRVSYANAASLDCMKIDRQRLETLNVKALGKPDAGRKEIVLKTTDGRRVPVRMSVHTLPDRTLLAVLSDISEINQLQQEILKMDRLASVGELTSGIAHEIRNPLAGIKTTAQALEEELPPYDHKRAYVSRIIAEIDRLNRLVMCFFDFAKPKALSVRECSLKQVIEDAVFMVREAAKKNNVQIMEFYPSKDIVVNVDPDTIRQVLMNVCINAVQSMNSGGRMEVHLSDEVTHAEIIISDTGKGIPENIRARIFDPFFTTKPKGIGLGLSISYRLIRMHSGNITFTSSPSGTTFRIALPGKK